MRPVALRLLVLVLFALPADAAFECLPGPAPGGLGDWAWPDKGRPGICASVAAGRPAAVDDLLWSQASASWRGRRVSISGDLYSLGLENLYRESAAGLWLGYRSIGAGVRGWRIGWADGTARAGWTFEGEARRCRGPLAVSFAAQGITTGKRDPAAPESRFCLGADLRAGSDLVLGAAAIRSSDRSAILGRLQWSPLPLLTLHEAILVPGSTSRSGIEIGTATRSVGLWVEPSERLGLRSGIMCCVQ